MLPQSQSGPQQPRFSRPTFHHTARGVINTIPPGFGGEDLILWGCIDSATTDEDALNHWWTYEHLPERLRLPGVQRARRYHALDREES